MFERAREDIQSIFHRDPAAHNALEVLTYYPGLHAVWLRRLAHGLWASGWKWLARLVSSFGRWMTDIKIHPGTRIDWRFSADYGMGIVIDETAEIGDDVTFYQGVTLGGTTWNRGKRHPTLGNNMVVGAGAKMLDPFTVGKGARVDSNAVVIKEVPPGTTVVDIPGWVIMCEDIEQQAKRQAMAGKLGFDAYGVGQNIPDPAAHTVSQSLNHLQAVDGRLGGMRQALTALGSDYYARNPSVLREKDFAGVKDEDGNPAA